MIYSYLRPSGFFSNQPNYVGIDTYHFNYFSAHQKKSNWCWAACLQMVLNYYGIEVAQENLAGDFCGVNLFGKTKDCPGSIEIITSNLNHCYSINSSERYCLQTNVNETIPSASTLFEALSSRRPVIIGYNTPGNSVGHAVVLTGLSFQKDFFTGQSYLHSIIVRDPSPSVYNQFNLGRIEYSAEMTTRILENTYAWWVPSLVKKTKNRLPFIC